VWSTITLFAASVRLHLWADLTFLNCYSYLSQYLFFPKDLLFWIGAEVGPRIRARGMWCSQNEQFIKVNKNAQQRVQLYLKARLLYSTSNRSLSRLCWRSIKLISMVLNLGM